MAPDEFRPITNANRPWGTVGLLVGVVIGVVSAFVGARALREQRAAASAEAPATAADATAADATTTVATTTATTATTSASPDVLAVPVYLSFPGNWQGEQRMSGDDGAEHIKSGVVPGPLSKVADELNGRLSTCAAENHRNAVDPQGGFVFMSCDSPNAETEAVLLRAPKGGNDDVAVTTRERTFKAAHDPFPAEGEENAATPSGYRSSCGDAFTLVDAPPGARVHATSSGDTESSCSFFTREPPWSAMEEMKRRIDFGTRWADRDYDDNGPSHRMRYASEMVLDGVYWRVDAVPTDSGRHASVTVRRWDPFRSHVKQAPTPSPFPADTFDVPPPPK